MLPGLRLVPGSRRDLCAGAGRPSDADWQVLPWLYFCRFAIIDLAWEAAT